MTFREARKIGQSQFVRRADWRTRWLRFDGAIAYQIPYDPNRRQIGRESVVRWTDMDASWFRDGWTVEPMPETTHYPLTTHVQMSPVGTARMYGWRGYQPINGRYPVYLTEQTIQRQFENTSGSYTDSSSAYYAERSIEMRMSPDIHRIRRADPATGALTGGLPSEGEERWTHYIVREGYVTPPSSSYDYDWITYWLYPDGVVVTEGTPAPTGWQNTRPDLLDPGYIIWTNPGVQTLKNIFGSELEISPDRRLTHQRTEVHLLDEAGTSRREIMQEKSSVVGIEYTDEYTPEMLRLRAIGVAAAGGYVSETESEIIAQMSESVTWGQIPSSSDSHQYPTYHAQLGRYRLTAEIPVYDGIGQYLFRWRVSGAGWDQEETLAVTPEIGAIIASTPLMDIAPTALGVARVSDAYAVFLPE